MLRLQHLNLLQFKNYSNRSFDFVVRIIAICGNNGAGKTNLLDAIHYLCFTKSYFTRLDGQNVQHGQTGFRIEGDFTVNEKEEKAVCILRETGKKEFSVNGDAYEKFSHHIGRYPCVVIAPDDSVLITGASRERRIFLDALISQTSKDYLQQLITYQKVLQQRNPLLKSAAETGIKDTALLDVLDKQLITPGEYIFNTRKKFLLAYLPVVRALYNEISRSSEEVNLTYESELLKVSFEELLKANQNKDFLLAYLPVVRALYNEISRSSEEVNLTYESELLQVSFEELLKANQNKDFLLQRTSAGIHRDDLNIDMNGQTFKITASQGQRKSLLFALKLAEMEVLKKEKGFAPLLLLDDVFEKLDEDRIRNLLNKVCLQNDGQVFITDTNEERLKTHLDQIGMSFQLIRP
ncbi:MAG: DNA replication/repair protein RecF [Bacteroidetes bacterium]|nr:DNA replication/repair protein RecF [Bacteroidota bacterium]